MPFSALKHMRQVFSQFTFGSVLYNWSLGNAADDDLIANPADKWMGCPEKGRWLCNGSFMVDNEHLEIHNGVWEPAGVSPQWLDHMHGFDWLRDLKTLGGNEARRQACNMLDSWARKYYRWSEVTWRPSLTGKRLSNWLSLYDFYNPGLTDAVKEHLLDSMIRQARHLSRSLPGEENGLPLLYGIKGLCIAGLSFVGREAWLEQGLDLLQIENERQILPDGGHVTRSPAQLLQALQIMIDIRAGLVGAGYPIPEQLQHTIDRMSQALRFFRYADKGLALFHGTQEGDKALMDSLLMTADKRTKILSNLPHTGYERATVGRSQIMMDTGNIPPSPHDQDSHAAPLAFEFTYGRERIFVNCGTHPLEPVWDDVLRGTAAHNTLGIDYRNVCEIKDSGHFGRKPRHVTIERQEQRGSVILEGSHDGYVPLNGIMHRRRIYLTDNGHNLTGQDSLSCKVDPAKPAAIALRFHLHPRVQVSLIKSGDEALLKFQTGALWRFSHGGGALALEDSIYLGEGCRPRKTKQLVIYGEMETSSADIKWALRREAK